MKKMKIKRKFLSMLVSSLVLISSTSTAFAEVVEEGSSTRSNGQNSTTLISDINASASWNKVYNWDIEKTVTPNTWDLHKDETGTSVYTVSVNKDNGTDEKYVEGQVLVTNGGSVATEGLAIAVKLLAPPSKTVLAETVVDTASQHAVLEPGESYYYNYRIDYNAEAGLNYKVTADITINNHSGYLGVPFGPSPSGNTAFPVGVNSIVNDSINVDDTNGMSWSFNTSDAVTYEKTFTYEDAGVYTNTATIRETGESSSVDVTVNALEDPVTEEPVVEDTTEYRAETTWAVDAKENTLNTIMGADKWGWYIQAKEGTFDVYAGAGQNDLNKGTLIGTVQVSVNEAGYYEAVFTSNGDHKVENMHFGVYANVAALQKTGGAPGKFTNKVKAGDAQYMAIHFDALVAE
jgi:hypothetical protein